MEGLAAGEEAEVGARVSVCERYYRRFVAFSPFALKCGLRVKIRVLGPNFQGSRFNGRPSVSKTESGGSNPSSPASLLVAQRAGNAAELTHEGTE